MWKANHDDDGALREWPVSRMLPEGLPARRGRLPTMRTLINGKPAEWTPKIRSLWESKRDPEVEGVISDLNYFTPRPWRNEYDRGSPMEGFVYTVNGRQVMCCQWDASL